MYNKNNFKHDFPIFTNHPDLVYLDSAATSQKPQQVINAVVDFYQKHNSNVHRGIYTLSQKATDLYETSRKKIANFIGAKDPAEIIFTGNASEAINLVAHGYAKKHLKKGDIIVLSEMEHHSNIVPWLRLKEEKGVKLFFIPLIFNRHSELVSESHGKATRSFAITQDDSFTLDYQSILKSKIPVSKIKLVTLTHASNVLGTINPVKEIISFLRRNKVDAKILIDAAQSIPHIPVNVKKSGCDFLVFSSHKMLGPSGVGVLWAKKEILEDMDPLLVGSHMISQVTKDKASWADIPDKFETGTGRLESVVGLGATIGYLSKIGMDKIQNYEEDLTKYALNTLSKIKYIDLYGSIKPQNRLGVFSFNIKGVHAHDVAEVLNRYNICVRSGHHCAQPLMKTLGVSSTVRASLYLYNTKEDVDKLVMGIEKVKRIFKV